MFNVDLDKLLKLAVIAAKLYRDSRDKVIAAGDPTDPNTGAVRSDEQLIAMFKDEASDAVDHIDSLIKKHDGATE